MWRCRRAWRQAPSSVPIGCVRVLGRGGMGVVFEAEDTRLHRRVALKAVSSPGGGDTDQQRLRREARAAAALVHPNIATVYALEEIDGRAYLATEYLDGETLREVLRRGPLPRADALAIAHALASGLEAAHRLGIVHRDLKPENVLRLPDGRVKILDFGLAHLEGEARQLTSVSRLTLHGAGRRHAGYMAPEQLLGRALDNRADQYALGIVLAEMVTGVHPLEAPTVAATIARVLAADGVASSAGPLLPPDIGVVVQRCTRQRAEDRYPSTADVVAAIAACQRLEATPRRRPRRPRLPGRRRRVSSAAPPAGVHRSGGGASTRPLRRRSTGGWSCPRGSCTATSRRACRGSSACLAATIVAANVRLHLRFSAAVLPHELSAQRAKTRGWVAFADWALVLLWAYAGAQLTSVSGEWSVVFFAFSIGAALAVGLIEPATTRAAFTESPSTITARGTSRPPPAR